MVEGVGVNWHFSVDILGQGEILTSRSFGVKNV